MNISMLTKWPKAHHKLFFLLIILILSGIIFFIRHSRDHSQLITTVKRGSIIEGVYGMGTVMTNRSFDLKPGVTTIIKEVFVKEGDEVKAGQKLINLDGTISKAPFSGIVTYFPFRVGENVFAQAKVLSITDFSDRYLVVSLEQEGALKVLKGQKAKLSFDSIREETYEGVVESVYSQGQTFLARIGIAHLALQILPGMTADVAIAIREHKNALLVPITALDSGFVYLRKNLNRTQKVSVKTGVADGEMAEVIIGDIHEGDKLEIREKLRQ